MADTRGWEKPAKRRKVQAMTLHREIMREAAVCSRMKPKFVTPKSFKGEAPAKADHAIDAILKEGDST